MATSSQISGLESKRGWVNLPGDLGSVFFFFFGRAIGKGRVLRVF